MNDRVRTPIQDATDRIVARAWREPDFRDLLVNDPQEALRNELGKIPEGMEQVRFQLCKVDRAVVRNTPDGRRLSVRPKLANAPISVVMRKVFGFRELVLVFYTKRCQYQCSFCTLPSASAYTDVSFSDISKQLEHGFAVAGGFLPETELISLGNEGSILDERTFPRDQLEHVLKRCAGLPSVRELILETRSEFVSEALLDQMLDWISPCKLTLKIGLESVDRRVREEILHKRMDLGDFERVISIMGRRGVRLASYVLVKADPAHDDVKGRGDAIYTCEYLKMTCAKHAVPLTLRINSMYKARDSLWARAADASGWRPPSIFDLATVMLAVQEEGVEVFAGLYDEGLATEDGHYEALPDFAAWALAGLEQYNQTGDLALLRGVAEGRPPTGANNGLF